MDKRLLHFHIVLDSTETTGMATRWSWPWPRPKGSGKNKLRVSLAYTISKYHSRRSISKSTAHCYRVRLCWSLSYSMITVSRDEPHEHDRLTDGSKHGPGAKALLDRRWIHLIVHSKIGDQLDFRVGPDPDRHLGREMPASKYPRRRTWPSFTHSLSPPIQLQWERAHPGVLVRHSGGS